MKIFALHGFLGKPEDWDFLGNDVIAFDLNRLCDPNASCEDLWAIARRLNDYIRTCYPSPRVLLGYSMGGRLALHMLILDPELWAASVIVSAHPGLSHDHEKFQRLQHDSKWSKRFKIGDWSDILRDWNSQDVFKNSIPISRNEADYNRDVLVHMLSEWSLAKQTDFSLNLKMLALPVLWMVGQRDAKYVRIAESLTFGHRLSKHCAIANSGHRIPWDQPEMFQSTVRQFLIEVNSSKKEESFL